VGPRAILDAVVKRKIPSSSRESNPRTPIIQPVAQRWALLYINKIYVKLKPQASLDFIDIFLVDLLVVFRA
jgi:hypothetical protein